MQPYTLVVTMASKKRFKVCLLGEGRVGKTSILLRFVRNSFDERQQSTLQASYLDRHITIGSQSVKLSIWDTAGQERFHALGPLYYRDANGALLVYDITDAKSFERVERWVGELRKIVGDDICIVIAGNKCDLEKSRMVSQEEAEKYAESVGAHHYQTSAKLGKNLETVFLDLTKQMIARSAGSSATAAGAKKRKTIRVVEDDEAPKPDSGGCKCG